MTTTIIIAFIIEAALCILLFMKGCMFRKYTPAALKKELRKQKFLNHDLFGLMIGGISS